MIMINYFLFKININLKKIKNIKYESKNYLLINVEYINKKINHLKI